MKNKLEDLRNHLFAALEGLSDADKPLDLDRAKTIAEVAQVVINSAKVELEAVRVSQEFGARARASEFFPAATNGEVQQGPQRPALRGA